jgi:TatD DNase family protein
VYLDAHVHLQDIKQDVGSLLEYAENNDVGLLFCNATSPEDWGVVLELAAENAEVIPFIGIHPWYIDKAGAGWEQILQAKLLENKRAGIGEIGLDRFKKELDFEKQKKIFGKQLEIAAKIQRPVVIHCVKAWGALIEILRNHELDNIPFIMHRFSGSIEIMEELIKLDAYFSFSTELFDNNKIKTIFGHVPVERIFLETDLPYMKKCNNNDPECYIDSILSLYKHAADLKGLSEEELKGIIWENGEIFSH